MILSSPKLPVDWDLCLAWDLAPSVDPTDQGGAYGPNQARRLFLLPAPEALPDGALVRALRSGDSENPVCAQSTFRVSIPLTHHCLRQEASLLPPPPPPAEWTPEVQRASKPNAVCSACAPLVFRLQILRLSRHSNATQRSQCDRAWIQMCECSWPLAATC